MSKRNMIWLVVVLAVGVLVWLAFGIVAGLVAAAVALTVSEVVERRARESGERLNPAVDGRSSTARRPAIAVATPADRLGGDRHSSVSSTATPAASAAATRRSSTDAMGSRRRSARSRYAASYVDKSNERASCSTRPVESSRVSPSSTSIGSASSSATSAGVSASLSRPRRCADRIALETSSVQTEGATARSCSSPARARHPRMVTTLLEAPTQRD